MKYVIASSPVGDITISSDKDTITGLHIEGDRYFTLPASWTLSPDDSLLRQAVREIREYFDGSRKEFTLPLHIEGTAFQRDVWNVLTSLPFGKTVSYGDVAVMINRPKAVRAVGTAVGRNPICILIPCHRVLATNGKLGGYVAGLACKEVLLKHEGVALSTRSSAAQKANEKPISYLL